jgi:hypothetical protein
MRYVPASRHTTARAVAFAIAMEDLNGSPNVPSGLAACAVRLMATKKCKYYKRIAQPKSGLRGSSSPLRHSSPLPFRSPC